jgi:hypothetical protein
MNFFFGVQYSLTETGDWAVEANYVGTAGRKLYAKFDVNRVNGDLFDGTLNRLNPSFGSIGYAMAPFTSSYEGGNASVKKRFSHGLSFETAFTFGKAIDYMSGFTSGNVIDISNWKTRRGPADFDVARKLSMNLSYHTPGLPGANKLVRAAAGSWQMGVVTILQSGAPLSVSCTTGFQAVRNANGQIIGNTNDVPNAPIGLGNLSGLDRSSYMTGIFKVSDFPIPAFGQEGNLGRGTYRGPGYANTDLSMIKNFKLPWYHSDRANLRFSAEAFNLFNRVNLADPNTTLNSTATFGRSTSARASRNIQFGMRLAF